MMYIDMISQLLISEWIWGLTWVFYHNFINVLIVLLLLKLFLGIRMVSAVWLSCCAQLITFLFFNIFVIGVLVLGFEFEYDAFQGWVYIPDKFYATFFLGLIYAFLQSLFFLLVNRYYKLHLSWVFVIVLISNSLTALLINLFLPAQL
jgi:hypothetical protein